MIDSTDTDRQELAESFPVELPLKLATPRWCYVVTAIVVTAIYLLSVMPVWRPTPDSALYLSLARSLAEGNGFQFNGHPHNIVTPGFPLILAGIRLALGECYWAFNLFIALCALGTLWLVYAVVRRLAGSGIALAIVLMTAFSYTFYLAAHKVITDIVFALAFWAVLYAYLRWRTGRGWWIALAAILALAGVFVRAPGLIVLGSLAVGVLLTPGKSGWIRGRLVPAATILLPIVLLAGAVFTMMYIRTGKVPLYISASLAEICAWKSRPVVFFDGLGNIPFAMSEMLTGQDGIVIASWGFLASLFAVVGTGVLWRRNQRWVPLAAFGPLVILAFMGGSAAVRPRYIIPVMPLLFYMSVVGLYWCFRRRPYRLLLRLVVASSALGAGWYALQPNGQFYYSVVAILGTWLGVEIFLRLATRFAGRPRSMEAVITVFALVGILASGPKIFRDAVYYGYLSHTGRFYRKVRGGAHAELFAIGRYLRENCPPDGQIATRGDMVSFFYYLSHRIIAYQRHNLARSSEDAETFARFVLSKKNDRIRLVVVDLADGNDAYVTRLIELLDASSILKLRTDYPGRRYRIYARKPPAKVF